MLSLRSSATRNGISIDYRGFVDPDIDTGVEGGWELAEVGREAARPSPNPSVLDTIRESLGSQAAVTAAELAGAFAMINRVMEATGQPVLNGQRQSMLPVLEELGALEFPHSGMSIDRAKTKWDRVVDKVLRR